MAPRQRSTIAAVSGFALLSLFSTWPVIRHAGTTLPGNLGDPLLNAWILGWDADRLRHGLTGFWNAPIFYPDTKTLAFSEHLLGIAVPLAPAIWLTRNPILAYNIAFVLTYVAAALGMFLLAREITGRTDAAVIAGLAFAFGPMRADQITHLQVLASGWMPIALWGLHRYFATFSRKALAIFVVAFVWQACSNGYFLYFLSLSVAVVMAFECASRWDVLKSRLGKTLAELAAAAAAILVALAPVIKVYVDVRSMYGQRRGYGDLVNFAANVESYFHVSYPVRLWSHWLAVSVAPERQLFPGLTALALAGLAVWSLRSPELVDSDRTTSGGGPHPPHFYVWCYLTITILAFLLSLGAEPTAWGYRVLPFSPYLVLSRIVPGLDGLRAPARISVVVLLGLSVLAAIGTARLLHTKKGVRPLFFLPLAAAIVAEGWSAPLGLVPFDARGRAADRPVYEWLAGKPQGGVLELPIKEWDVAPTLTYQYATLFHHHQLVNGYSGYGATLQAWLGARTSPMNELGQLDVVVDALQSTGVRYVIVHRDDYGADTQVADETITRLRSLTNQIAETKDFGNTTAVELSNRRKFLSPPLAPSIPVSLSRLRATASDGNDRLFAAFDANRDSKWYSGQRQSGDEWIRIDFDRPLQVEGIRLLISERSLGDYPRDLAIDAIDKAGNKTTLRRGPVLAELAKGLLADGDYPWIDISVPSKGPIRAIVLRQTGTTQSWYWSIHELQVMASPDASPPSSAQDRPAAGDR